MTPWTVVCQASLFMGFPRQEYWCGLPFPSPEDLPNPGIKPASPALAGGFFTTEPPGKPTLPILPSKQKGIPGGGVGVEIFHHVSVNWTGCLEFGRSIGGLDIFSKDLRIYSCFGNSSSRSQIFNCFLFVYLCSWWWLLIAPNRFIHIPGNFGHFSQLDKNKSCIWNFIKKY